MNHLKTDTVNLHLGLEKPVRILQLTDVHISLADERDVKKPLLTTVKEPLEFAAKRRSVFFGQGRERDPIGYFQEAMEYSKEFDCTVITGDLIDFNSWANYDCVKEILAGKDYLFTPGSHEFCPNYFEAKARHMDAVQSIFRGNILFESRVVGGVNVVAMDNSYYMWTEEQMELMKTEIARGLPILLFCHVPIRGEYHPQGGGLQLSEDLLKLNIEFNQLLQDESLIKAVFCGHMHTAQHYLGSSPKPCYIMPSLFTGVVGEIVID
ncbi:MAG: metallophosphoesterase [Clostridia bacterium]|nr:metallophosphoesterase [Clostridia bacterium]